LLERCNSFATQATLVTGFAFTSFSASALTELSYTKSPERAFLFVLTGATTMALSIASVGVSSFLTGKAERIAMEVDVRTAVALVRYRISWVSVPFYMSLITLWTCAAMLVFATCSAERGEGTDAFQEEYLCMINATLVVVIFVLVGGFVTLYPRWLIYRHVEDARQGVLPACTDGAQNASAGSEAAPISLGATADQMRQPLRREAGAVTGREGN
jgi:hypothetical protein